MPTLVLTSRGWRERKNLATADREFTLVQLTFELLGGLHLSAIT